MQIMRNKINLIWCLLLSAGFISAQQNWAWMAGTGNSYNVNSSYGTQNVASSSNDPGFRSYSQMCTDASGNVWLFGGNTNAGMKNDLWKFDPTTGFWTYVSGTSGTYSYGNYGSQGVGSTSNYPGCRYLGSMVSDNNGNLWLFGGYGFSSNQSYIYLNDMWKYNIASGQWTWVKGSNTASANGVYGTMGTANSSNIPGARHYHHMTKDLSGNIWLFGGYGYNNFGNAGPMNDLWKFDPSTSNFTWMGGTTSTSIYGVSGTLGTGSTSNYPGCRYGGGIAADASGNIWVFSGYGYTSNNYGYTNDLWRFVPSTGVWTWMSGSQSVNTYGVYGTQGTGSTSNYPGSRFIGNLNADNAGNLWVSPAYGYAQNSAGTLNDLWKYNISNSQWTWVKGSSTPSNYGTYGTLGLASSSSVPGSRDNNVNYAFDATGNIWLMGGYGFGANSSGNLNDLWRFNVCAVPNSPTFQNTNNSIFLCSGNSSTLAATTNTGTILWYASPTSSTTIGTGTSFIPTGLTAVGNASLYTYYATGSVSCGTSLQRSSITITVNPTPTISVNSGSVCAGTPFVMVPTGATSYSYTGGNTQVVYPTTSTSYTVTGYSSAGCTNTTNVVSNVAVSPSPTITVNSGSICSGSSYTINASGASTYTFSSGSNIVAPTTPTFYTVSGTSSQGCTSFSPAIVNVMVYGLPTVSASNGTVCAGQSFVLTPSGASTYIYSSGSATVTPTSNTTYSIIGTSAQGCVSSNTAVASVSVITVNTITANSGSICVGGSYTITPSGSSNYNYSSLSPVVSPNTTTSYTVTGSAFGCNAIPAVVTVTVNALPVVNVTSGAICAGSSFTLNPSGASTYSYVNGGPVVTPTTTTVYGIIGTSNGCTGVASSATVVVNAIPVMTAADGTICLGDNFVIMPTGADSYTYSSGAAAVTPTTTSSYTVSGESTAGCDASDIVVNVAVNNPPALNPVATGTSLCAGESATITVGTASSYMWANSNSNNPTTTTLSSNVVSPSLPTTYTITGVSAEGCSSSAVIAIKVSACTGLTDNSADQIALWPNPNNGNFTLRLNDKASVTIFNQLGQLIQTSNAIAGDNHLDIENKANGIYYVTVQNGQFTQTIKIVKQ